MQNRSKVKALIISHGHEDPIGDFPSSRGNQCAYLRRQPAALNFLIQ